MNAAFRLIRRRPVSNDIRAIVAANRNSGERVIYTPPDPSTNHTRVIAFLARRSAISIDEVTRLYEQEWATLETTARLDGFVPSLTFGHVRRLLRRVRNKVPTTTALPPAVVDGMANAGGQ